MQTFIARRVRSAFTLIELLVVIAIIAILAAILFPVFGRARENARRSACQSNLKQIGLGIMQYSQDFDETYPSGNIWKGGNGWAGQTSPYLKSTQIFKCPNDTTSGTFYIGQYHVISYGYNRNFTQAPSGANTMSTLASMAAPAKTVMLNEIINNAARVDVVTETDSCTSFGNTAFEGYGTDNGINGGHCIAETGYMGIPAISTAPASYKPTGRHFDGSNFLFSDGHVKWLRPNAVSPGINAIASGDAQGAGTTSYGNVAYSRAAGTDVSTFQGTFSVQ